MAEPPIALMTDFGLRDPFVGIMKGVILGINPSANVLDLCHEIEQGDIRSAAFALKSAFTFFPDGTIFTVVVDPGVGTKRRALVVRVENRTVVCPDNGILSWILKERSIGEAVSLENPDFFLPQVSDTFHGRDVFAPVAAHLSVGVKLSEMGTTANDPVTFPIPEPSASDIVLEGEVVYIDRFGNLITNVDRAIFDRWRGETAPEAVQIHMGTAEIKGVHRSYAHVNRMRPVAVIGSAGYLEIAVNGGSAAHLLNALPGDSVRIFKLRRV